MTLRLLCVALLLVGFGCESLDRAIDDTQQAFDSVGDAIGSNDGSSSEGSSAAPGGASNAGGTPNSGASGPSFPTASTISFELPEPANDTALGAVPIPVGGQASGEVGRGSDRTDYWRVAVEQDGYLRYSLKNLHESGGHGTHLGPSRLLDQGQNQVSNLGRIQATREYECPQVNATAGNVYYIEVTAAPESRAKYELRILFKPQ